MTTSQRLLDHPVAKNLTSAAVAGVVTYLRPARIPKWARRGVLAGNTAGAGATMLLGQGADGPAGPVADRLGTRTGAVTGAAGVLSALTGGIGLLTSTTGLRMDARAEQFLLNRGVGRPRLLMAFGAAGVVLAVGMLTDYATAYAERKAAELQQRQQQPQVAAPKNGSANHLGAVPPRAQG